MKNTHGTDFSRMMRSMQGPRQVGSLGVMRPQSFRSFTQTRRDSKDVVEETSLLPRRISADLLVSSRKTPQATRLFLRKFSTDSQEIEFQSARAARNQAQMTEIKSQLIKLVDEEIKESQQEIDFCNTFLARTGFKLTTGSEGRITLTKAIGKISVTVWFSVDEKENESEETEEAEDDEGEVHETTSEDRIPGAGIDVVAQITLVDKSNKELTKLTLSCLAEVDKLFIVTMHSADGNSVLEFDELSDNLQWKIYEYFESLALDNDLAHFVSQYVNHSHDHKNVAVLKDLKLTLLSC